MADERRLLVSFGANTSGLVKGVNEVKTQLTSLNKNFIENQSIMKATQKEYSNLEKEQKKLNETIKAGTATKEQTAQYEANKNKIDALILKKAQLKTTEQTLSAEINKTKKSLEEQNTLFDTAKNKIGGMSTALKLAATGYTGKKLFDVLIGSNAEMEQYQTSFEVMLGSQAKAQQMMKDLTQFASATPFTLQQTVPQATLLMSYGVQAKDLISTMTKLGDLSSGNSDKFNRIALAYGQMLAKGKVTGEELMQITEAGVPLMQTLADTMGVTTAQYSDMQEKGKVSIEVLNQGIDSLTTGTGKFAGMMEKQSKTMNGMLSTVKDNFQLIGREVGEGAFSQIKIAINEILVSLQQAQADGTLKEKAEEIGASIGKTIKTLWDLKEVIGAVATGYVTFKISMSIGSTIASLAQALRLLKTATEETAIAQTALNTTMKANPIVLVVSALVSLMSAIGMYSALKEKTAKVEYVSTENLEKETTALTNLSARYEQLGKKTNLTGDEKAQLTDIQNQLAESYGAEAKGIDVVNGKYDEQLDKLKNLSKERLQDLQNQQITNANTAKKVFDNSTESVWATGKRNQSLSYDVLTNSTSNIKGVQAGYDQNGYWGMDISGNSAEKYNAVVEVLRRLNEAGATDTQLFDDLTKKSIAYRTESEKLVETLKALGITDKSLNDTSERAISDKKMLASLQFQFGKATEQATETQKIENLTIEQQNQMLSQNEVIMGNTEAHKTAVVAMETASRIGMYGKEVAGIKSVADANFVLMQMEEQRFLQAIRINSYYDAQSYNTNYGTGSDYQKLKNQVEQLRSIMGVIENAKNQALSNASSVFSGGVNTPSSSFNDAQTEVKNEISAVELYTAALKKLSDDRIEAIDREIAARNKLKETATTQKEIDNLNALIKYQNGSQMDSFSKNELIRKRDSLLQQQADSNWLEQMNAKKQQIQDATSYLTTAIQGSQTPTAQSIINNNSRQANVNLALTGMTSGQVSSLISQQLRELLGI
mgnify:CR=1 FL=1